MAHRNGRRQRGRVDTGKKDRSQYAVDTRNRAVEEYIRFMGKISKYDTHEVIVECLEHYDLSGTRELTAEQAERFLRRRGIRMSF